MRVNVWKFLLILMGVTLCLSASSNKEEIPDWLSGRPDLEIRPELCRVYKWFFNVADKQTNGKASTDELASLRLYSLANKLVDHHHQSSAEKYGARVKYLVLGDGGPSHFKFTLSNDKLDELLKSECDN